ncbi:MAG: helix-turn-helix transcriptional regulator [Syntrophaceae bacterium]|nr:helix-turn-helix transcriptional regulator [Syntrophaceae bacterium]
MAKMIGVTPEHLNAVIRGRTRPSLNLALRIAHETGVPVIEILSPWLSLPKDGKEQA